MKKNIAKLIALFAAFVILTTSVAAVNPYGFRFPYHTTPGAFTYTDIVAYINGVPVRSYNVSGTTVIVAEDLAYHGFDVVYNNDTRTLFVNAIDSVQHERVYALSFDPTLLPKVEKVMPMGAAEGGRIYETDIKVYVGNDKNCVTSYNIGGETVIPVDALSMFGTVEWFSEQRVIAYTYDRYNYWVKSVDYDVTDVTANDFADGFYLSVTKNADGIFNRVDSYNTALLSGEMLVGNKTVTSFIFGIDLNAYAAYGEGAPIESLFANKALTVKVNGKVVPTATLRSYNNGFGTGFEIVIGQGLRLDEIKTLEISFPG